MPSPSRRTLLIAAAVVVLGTLAALPAPRLIFRRSPSVAERLRGDVRHVAMAIEPGTGYLHAVLEVWTGSDWDVEYWTSRGFSPVARIVVNDLLDQGSASLALDETSMAMAYVTHDRDAQTWTLAVSQKGILHRTWGEPVTVATGDAEISATSVAIRGSAASVAFVRAGRMEYWDGHAISVIPGSGRATNPSLAVSAAGAAIAFERAGGVVLARSAPGRWDLAAPGRDARSPVVRAAAAGWDLAWAQGSGAGAMLLGPGIRSSLRTYPIRAGTTFRPALALTDSNAVVALWTDASGVHRFSGAQRDDRAGGACCPSIATGGTHLAETYLQFRQGKGIFRDAHVFLDGRELSIPVATR